MSTESSSSIWMGDIEGWMDEAYIASIYTDLELEVISVKIMKDKLSGAKLGYCFVEFTDPEIAKNILENLNGKRIGSSSRFFKLNWASYSVKLSSNDDYTMYVGDLDPNLNEQNLLTFFKRFYTSVFAPKIIIEPFTRFSKGYGFVKFTRSDEFEDALLKMNGKMINGRPIKVNRGGNKKYMLEQTFGNFDNVSPNRVILNGDFMPIPINDFFKFTANNSPLDTSANTSASQSPYLNIKTPPVSHCRSSEFLPRITSSHNSSNNLNINSNINNKRNSVSASSSNLFNYYSDTLASLSSMCKHIELDRYGRAVEKFSCEDILNNMDKNESKFKLE